MPVVVGVGASVNGANVNITPPYPAAYTAIANDIGITFLETNSEAIAAPSGWTQVTAISVTSGNTTRLAAYWRRFTGGDTAPAYAGTTDHKIGRMIVVSGCRTSGGVAGEPYEFGASASELVSDTSASIPGVTTTIADQLMLYAFSTGRDITSTAEATGWADASLGSVTERMDSWTATGGGGGFGMASGTKAVAGATGAMTVTVALANFKAYITISLVGAATVAGRPKQSRRYKMQPRSAGQTNYGR